MRKVLLAALACDGLLFAIEPRWGAIGGFFLVLAVFVGLLGQTSE